MRTGIYARVSTTDQTCEQQLTSLREYVEARKWKSEGEYVDQAVSGTKASRPAMNRLMDKARSRKVDAIVVLKIDRWGRSVGHFVQSMLELKSLGVRFVATTQGIDTDESNPASKFLMNILASVAEFEREIIIERTMMGLQRARREGRVGGRRRKVFDRQRVLDMRKLGKSVRHIAETCGVSPTTVHRVIAGGLE